MRFEWDAVKNRANARKHGLDFTDAEDMFRGILIMEPDTREDYGEKRWRGIGTIRGLTAWSFLQSVLRTSFASFH